MTKKDYKILFLIISIYSLFLFFKIGTINIPKTFITFNKNDNISLDLGEEKEIDKISVFMGGYYKETTITNGEHRPIDYPKINISTFDNENSLILKDFIATFPNSENKNAPTVFSWDHIDVDKKIRFINLDFLFYKEDVYEICIFDKNGNKIIPINILENNIDKLFDEQDKYSNSKITTDNTYDEPLYIQSAYQINNNLITYEDTHPPLGKIIISIGITVFGNNPLGFRFMSALFGLFLLITIYIFSKKIFKSIYISSFSTILFATDFMLISQSRLALIDIFTIFFIVSSYYFMYCYFEQKYTSNKSYVYLLLSGLFMGLSIACKWTGVYAAFGLAIIFFIKFIKDKHTIKKRLSIIAFCFLSFIIIPLLIYTTSYLFINDGLNDNFFDIFINNQFKIFEYHKSLTSTHIAQSKWYSWMFLKNPVFIYTNGSQKLYLMGNPMIWTVGTFLFFYILYKYLKTKDNKALFVIIGYLSQYLPWALVPRYTFLYHYFPSIPFIILIFAYFLNDIITKNIIYKKYANLYLILSSLLFIIAYKFIVGI